MGTFLAGGGMNTGQIIGQTDRTGGEASERPIHIQEVLATCTTMWASTWPRRN